MKVIISIALLFIGSFCAFAQEENIVKIIDDLTLEWDEAAVKLETYEGLSQYCRDRAYRDNTIALLNQIHHYDSSLYNIVTEKYATSEDAEAKATLEDIEKLELNYATKRFLSFLRKECMSFNDNERNKNIDGYDEMVSEIESEMVTYVEAITLQIDIIDEHAHHLKGL